MNGFTLLELLLSVTLLSVIFFFSLVLYDEVLYRSDLEGAAHVSQSLLRKATFLSSATEGDSQWGVHFEDDAATLFKGSSYALRDDTFDETAPLEGVELSGTDEYVFSKMRGLPLEAGTTTFTHISTEDSLSVGVNEQARISIE